MAHLVKIRSDCHMSFMNEISSVHTKLDEARGELLDLSLRNTLINYKPLKSRGVDVVGESPSEVYRILVQDGKRCPSSQDPNQTISYNWLEMMK